MPLVPPEIHCSVLSETLLSFLRHWSVDLVTLVTSLLTFSIAIFSLGMAAPEGKEGA